MSRPLSALLWCAAWLLPAAAAAAVLPEPREVRLANGVRVLLAPDSLAAAVDVASWHSAGTGLERPAQSGAAFLLERIALRGDWNPAAARELAQLKAAGGTHGSLGTHDFTSFYETLPPEALATAVRLEAARMAGPQLTDAKVSREKRAARESVQRVGEGGPIGRALQRLFGEVFGGHPYGLRGTGEGKARDALTRAGLQSYAARYGPPGSVITITGRFDPDSTLALLRRTVGQVPRRPAPAASAAALSPARAARRAEPSEGRARLLAAAWRLPGAADSARAVFPLLSHLLTGGPGARLMQPLLEAPNAPCLRLEGSLNTRAQASILYFVAALRENADTARVAAAVLEAARRLASEPPSADELEQARHSVEIGMLAERQSARGRGNALGTSWMLSGSWREEARDLERVRTVTPEEVRQVAARVLAPEAFTVVWFLPGPAAGEVDR